MAHGFIRFYRRINLLSGQSNIWALPPGLVGIRSVARPNGGGGAAGLVEFTISEGFHNSFVVIPEIKNLAGVITDNGGGEFTFDPDGPLDLTTIGENVEGNTCQIRTATQGPILATITTVTPTVLTLQEVATGTAFATESPASVTIHSGPDGESLHNPNDVIWVPWSTGSATQLASQFDEGSFSGIRVTASGANNTDFEIIGQWPNR